MKREGESELAPFDQNLLIPLDLSRLRQIVIKLVSRLLTNLKTVESAPLIPKKRRFSGPSLEPSWNQITGVNPYNETVLSRTPCEGLLLDCRLSRANAKKLSAKKTIRCRTSILEYQGSDHTGLG